MSGNGLRKSNIGVNEKNGKNVIVIMVKSHKILNEVIVLENAQFEILIRYLIKGTMLSRKQTSFANGSRIAKLRYVGLI